MKKLLLLSALMAVMSSCYKDQSLDADNTPKDSATPNDVLTHMQADQSRIIRRNAANVGTYAATRAVSVEDAEHPLTESPVLADIANAQELTSDQNNNLSNGGVWKISKNSTNKQIWINNVNSPLEIYVEASDVSIGLNSANNNISTIYVLKEAENFTLSNGTLASGWKLKAWNYVNFGGGSLTMCSDSWFCYYGEQELKMNFYIQNPAGTYYFESHAPVTFTNDVNITIGDYWFGEEVIFEQKFSTDNNYSTFIFNGPVEFRGTGQYYEWWSEPGTRITRGYFEFKSSVKFSDLYVTNDKVNMIFNECASVGKFSVGGNSQASGGLDLYINYYLEFTDGIKFENGSTGKYHLNNSVMVICGEADKGNSGQNVFVNEHYIIGEGNSAVFIQGSITGVELKENDRIFTYFRTGESPEDRLAVFGKRYKNGDEVITEEPVIYLGWASNDWTYVNDGYNTKFNYENVIINPSDLDDNFVIGSNDDFDCRADYTWGTQPPSQDEILPPAKHKYSATGLAFDGNYVYICWHSNLPGGETQDDGNGGSFDHDHGTNKDPDREGESGYGGPSVDNDKDWGGIIDIVQINNYHPDNADLYIASTVWNPEHKYNHVTYYDNKLYLASTSWNIGAALHVVPLIPSSEGVGQTFDSANAIRTSLTGNSANCVEIVDEKYIVTISGRSEGGLNWFSLTDETNQSKKYKNSSTVNYGGKYVYDDGKYIYALHNTDNATVTAYNRNGEKVGERTTGVALVPYDGKNAMMVKDGIVYICCGRNGLYAFDWNSGEKVGQSKMSANCVDVDDNGYIYVATGGGLAVFKTDNKKEDTKEYNTINYVAYTGKGFIYPNGWEKDGTMPDGTAKESSNFVRVRDGKVFIAYGMYGLRIYSADELINNK